MLSDDPVVISQSALIVAKMEETMDLDMLRMVYAMLGIVISDWCGTNPGT